jgi:large subunit ribosomal protein L18
MKYDLQAIRRKNKKLALHLKRKAKIRKIIVGTKERPRLSVFKSAKHIYIQAIDDSLSRTIASACSTEPAIRDRIKGLKKVEVAKLVGEVLGKKLVDSKISTAVFDRNGFRYTGRIAAIADGVRSASLTI